MNTGSQLTFPLYLYGVPQPTFRVPSPPTSIDLIYTLYSFTDAWIFVSHVGQKD